MTIKGSVESISFRNEDNGFTVLTVSVPGQKDQMTCVGSFASVVEGDYLEMEGEMVRHPMYGEQLSVKSYRATEPEDAASMELYLGSGAIKGIGKSLAARIIKAFGDDTFRVIEEEPEKLVSIKGISERIAFSIATQFEDLRGQRRSMMFLQQYGISGNLAIKIYKQFGPDMYNIIQDNPYILAEKISGIGFKTADSIASRAGISANSEYRIRAGVAYTLSESTSGGHTYLPYDELISRSANILGVSSEEVSNQVDRLLVEKKLIMNFDEEGGKCIYLSAFFFMEFNVARILKDLAAYDHTGINDIAQRIASVEKELGLKLDELQKKAVTQAAVSGVFILTGGPGTGKTTTINAIIRFFEDLGLDILLAAPTGRAAKRIYETTGREASTIHRLLELKVSGENMDQSRNSGFVFERNADNPLEADVVIIDEMSMVDISLMNALLKAVSVGTRLILVGDVNQLPSVGPGNVLKDIINSGAFSVTTLNTIFRQDFASDIIVNAHRINAGEQLILNNKSKDFFLLRRDNAQKIIQETISMVGDRLPRYIGAKPFDIQVLTPMRKGDLGVENLNNALQETLNPASKAKREKEYRDTVFREGDKVMQIRNNYQLEWEVRSKRGFLADSGSGVFNGDSGVITAVNTFSSTMEVMFDDDRRVDYPFQNLDELELAYAVTVHKSQGSEYPAVVIPLLSGPSMLFSRNILYTAVTRARKCVMLIGTDEIISSMIKNIGEQKRYSGLKARIVEL
ncbi:MAG: ATP-dependent RecD-like DNA helicase [Lachnospiraceae bacterium]|nr:ATP-dependent RecD-like DNA helicase [Lachnospiraceae bacterium]